MKRRDFLQRASAAVAGGAAVLSSPASRSVPAAENVAGAAGVLITSAQTQLAQSLGTGLAGTYSVRLTAATQVETELPFTLCEFQGGEETEAVVRGMQAIVHVPPAVLPEEELALVESWPRQTYHLLRAAARAGVQRVVYLSSLSVVSGYDPQYLVDEDWQPLVVSGSGQLPHHLGEFCCREFARERKLQVLVLRLGRVLRGEPRPEPANDPECLDERDAVQVVERALATRSISDGRGIDSWSVCHVTSGLAGSRFPIDRAKRLLGYEPRFGG